MNITGFKKGSIEERQAQERLRQEAEIFDQQKRQDMMSFCLEFWFGVALRAIFVSTCIIAAIILINNYQDYAPLIVGAIAAFFNDSLKTIITVYKGTLLPRLKTKLTPTTPMPTVPMASRQKDISPSPAFP